MGDLNSDGSSEIILPMCTNDACNELLLYISGGVDSDEWAQVGEDCAIKTAYLHLKLFCTVSVTDCRSTYLYFKLVGISKASLSKIYFRTKTTFLYSSE